MSDDVQPPDLDTGSACSTIKPTGRTPLTLTTSICNASPMACSAKAQSILSNGS